MAILAIFYYQNYYPEFKEVKMARTNIENPIEREVSKLKGK